MVLNFNFTFFRGRQFLKYCLGWNRIWEQSLTFPGKPAVCLQDLVGRSLPNFGPYAKERATLIANMKQAGHGKDMGREYIKRFLSI
jgi:hypothetical protein